MSGAKVQDQLEKPVLDEAVLALKFAAEQQNLALYAVDAEWIAAVVAKRSILAAVNTGSAVDKATHDNQVSKLKSRADQFSNSWASVMVQADKQLQRVQTALAGMEDRALAEKLAKEIGVILPEADDALFEAGAA